MQPLRATPPFRADLLATHPWDLPPAVSPFSHLRGIEYRGDTVTFPAVDYREAQSRTQALIGIAKPSGARRTLQYLRRRPGLTAAFRAVSDSIFAVELPAFENRAHAARDSAEGRAAPAIPRQR